MALFSFDGSSTGHELPSSAVRGCFPFDVSLTVVIRTSGKWTRTKLDKSVEGNDEKRSFFLFVWCAFFFFFFSLVVTAERVVASGKCVVQINEKNGAKRVSF